MTEVETATPTVTVVYTGRRWNAAIKSMYQTFAPIELFDSLDDPSVSYEYIDQKSYTFKKLKVKFTAHIGCVYEMRVDLNAEGKPISFYLSTLKFLSQKEFKHKSVWLSLDKVVSHIKLEESLQKKSSTDSRLAQSVKHIQWVYKQMPPSHRKAFLISIMKEISE
jgi:hypothetical protein